MSDQRTPRQLLAPYVMRRWSSLAGATFATCFLTVAELAAPWPLKAVVDHVLERGGEGFTLTAADKRFVLLVAAAAIAFAIVRALAAYLADLWLNRAGEQIVHDLRTATYAHLQRRSLAFHDERPKGDLVSRVTSDVAAVGLLFSESLGAIAAAILLLVGMAIVTFMLDPVLALATFAIAPVLFTTSRHYQRAIRLSARRQRREEGEIASLATEALSAMRVVKALGSEDYESRRVRATSERRLDAGVAVVRAEGQFAGIVDVLGAISGALVLAIGVLRVSAGALSPGDLVVFSTYAAKTYRPLRDIARQASKVARSLARAERVAEILAADDLLRDRPGARSSGRSHGHLAFTHVTFAYPDGRVGLRDLDLRVGAGECVAIVGGSGAGKSTIAALAARFYDPQAGAVTLDGTDLRDCATRWLRDEVGLLVQDTVLFAGSVASNIAYGTDASDEQIVAAALRAGAHEFIERLPAGYATMLGPSGVGLSGGQRQRIGIARVLLRDPSVLILDEPTTGLDATTEADLRASLLDLMNNRTTLLITHSLALARRADRVVVVDAGRIVDDGPPDVLIERGGPFRDLALQGTTAPRPRRVRPPAPHDAVLGEIESLVRSDLTGAAIARVFGGGDLGPGRVEAIEYVPHQRIEVVHRFGDRLFVVARGEGVERSRQRVAELDAVAYAADDDPRLPLAGASAATLRRVAADAGLTLAGGPAPLRLRYRVGTAVVLQLGDVVFKQYADDEPFRAGRRALAFCTDHAELGAPRLLGAVPNLRVTMQTAVGGARPARADAARLAPQAAAVLTALHTLDGGALESCSARRVLADAAARARVAGVVVSRLEARIDDLLRLLGDTLPPDSGLVPVHGDFNLSQFVVDDGALAVVDFDALTRAAPALDLASYAANLIGGRPGDDDTARGALADLCDGYGSTPTGLDWYVAALIARRLPMPFRLQKSRYDERAEAMLTVAEQFACSGVAR